LKRHQNPSSQHWLFPFYTEAQSSKSHCLLISFLETRRRIRATTAVAVRTINQSSSFAMQATATTSAAASAAATPRVEQAIRDARTNESATILLIEHMATDDGSNNMNIDNDDDNNDNDEDDDDDNEDDDPPRLPLLTATDARHIVDCLGEGERPNNLDTLEIYNYDIDTVPVLNVFGSGLPMCECLTTVSLVDTELGNAGLSRLRPAFYNTSVRKLRLYGNDIHGSRGGQVLRDLMHGNQTLLELDVRDNAGRARQPNWWRWRLWAWTRSRGQ
jgi:hypothetical protein